MNTTNIKATCNILRIIILLILSCLYYACSQNDGPLDSWHQVSIVNLDDPYRALPNYKFTASAQSMREIYKKNGIQNPDSFVKYSVSYHRIEYTTTYKGNQIKVSGAIVIPIHPVSTPSIVSFQHGTMFADRDAPSNAKSVDNITPIFNEYILFLPDYIGYGSSKGTLHPYFIYEPIVTTVVDMIKAGKKYLNDNQVQYDTSKLFLTGHSEGGYVTIAVQKELETNPVEGLKVTASAPSAGPYDVGLIGKLLLQHDTYPSPSYLILIFSAYNDNYWQRPITDFIKQPYASYITYLLGGNYNEEEINKQLTTNLTGLLNQKFLSDFRGDGELALKNAFISNSVNNWAPKTPTHLYHGTSDDLVPFEISQDTYNSFIANGSDTSNVKLVPLPGIGHDYIPAYTLILDWFKSFK
jgi:pimeloyl-ACP methyl ester carboxylesterase